MLCGDTTFTRTEITRILKDEGLQEGSEDFQDSVRRRFVPTEQLSEKGETLFIES